VIPDILHAGLEAPLWVRYQGQRQALAFVWDASRCTYRGEMDPLKEGKPIVYKVCVLRAGRVTTAVHLKERLLLLPRQGA
jgi:hypothetical protein